MSPIKIYSMALQDRSDRVRWLLEELQIPYQNIFLKKKNGDMNTPEYRKLNPMGRVPTIDDGGTIIHESAAICLYLADKYRQVKLAPEIHDPQRAEYLQWMVFSTATLECVVAKMFYLDGKSEAEKTYELNYIKEQCEIIKLAIEPVLSKQDYFLKSGFSAVDIMMAAVLPGAEEFLAPTGSGTARFLERMRARPLAQKVEVFG